jgi:Flp pilus assembly protein TadD
LALEIDPKNAHALHGRSLALRQSGDAEAADRDAAQAKLIRPNVAGEFVSGKIN